MSIELPEATILAQQMNRELKGKRAASFELKNAEKMQKLGMFNRNRTDYERLLGRTIESVVSRGLVVCVKFDASENLLLAPEYGGKILYHPTTQTVPDKFHFKLSFTDGSAFSVALSGFGGVQVLADASLNSSYIYRRDFSSVPSPSDDAEFSFATFRHGLDAQNANVKTALVGKDALIVGLSNSAFQDVIFRASIHPKRKASSLADVEKRSLYDAVKALIDERINSGGKNQFNDFYGKPGGYHPLMGSSLEGKACKRCGTTVQAVNLGGGVVFFCPHCQK